MSGQISVLYPEALAWSLKMQEKEFENEIKTLSLVKLYELGKISSGVAAKFLNTTKVDFLNTLAKYDVSYFSTSGKDLLSDFNNA